MSAFSFRLWRLGWARRGVVRVAGWRLLFWRIWWRLPKPADPAAWESLTEEVKALNPKQTVHWSPVDGLPICGASKKEHWTFEFEYATCIACREHGEMMLLQHQTNTR